MAGRGYSPLLHRPEMTAFPVRRCLFYYLRIFMLTSFCLWVVFIAFDRFLLTADRPTPSAVPFYLPCAFVNDSSRCYPSGNANSTAEFSPFVELRPYHLNSVQLALFWTPYFSLDALSQKRTSFFSVLFGDSAQSQAAIFYRPKLCYRQYPRCLITTNRAYTNQSQAIIFHWRDLNTVDLPIHRSPHQLWALYNLEAPPNTKPLPEDVPQLLFNLTATYRTDSDIVIPYGKLVALERSQPLPSIDLHTKTKSIAWFVSNCHTQSHREDFVKQLARYLPVDIYGKCGQLSCEPPNSRECYLKVARQYLFYLSFENSICKDYVTEKLFSILDYNLIPVVFGGANYSSFMPPHSYIDATEMKPHELAKLLITIAHDQAQYLRYFEWKQHYRLEGTSTKYNELLYCELCRRMEEDRRDRPTGRRSLTAKQVNFWYFEKVCNERKVQFF